MDTFKIVVFLQVILVALGILSSITYAKETIDLQQYVSCDFDTCTLSVDINELTLSPDAKNFLKNAKHEDITSVLSDLPDSIKGFDYYIQDKEKLIVTADIEPASQNYWFMEFETFILDPWFNSSYPYRQNNTLYSPYDSSDYYDVLVNISLDTASLISADKMQSDCDDLIIWSNNEDIELNYTLEACNNETSQIWLVVPTLYQDNSTVISALYGNNETTSHDCGDCICSVGLDVYYLFNDSDDGTSYDVCNLYDLDSVKGSPTKYLNGYFKRASDYDDSNEFYYGDNTWDLTSEPSFALDYWIRYDGISDLDMWFGTTTQGNSRVFSMISNWGTCDGDITFSMTDIDGDQHEICMSENPNNEQWYNVISTYDGGTTGTMRLFVNMNEYTDDQGATLDETMDNWNGANSNYTLGSKGNLGFNGQLDNFRIWNELQSDEVFYIMYVYATEPITSGWSLEEQFNETPIEPPTNITSYPVSFVFCIDNNTLINNETLIINSLINNTIKYTLCVYGCDNVTRTCSPEPFIQDVYTYLIIAGFCFIMFLIYKKVR